MESNNDPRETSTKEIRKNSNFSNRPRGHPNRGHNSTSSQFRRRNNPRPPALEANDIIVTEKSDIDGLLSKCQKLLKEESTRYIHIFGIAEAIPLSINMALRLKSQEVDFSVNTTSINLIDDSRISTTDDNFGSSQNHAKSPRNRNNSSNSKLTSAVKIKIFKTIQTVQNENPS